MFWRFFSIKYLKILDKIYIIFFWIKEWFCKIEMEIFWGLEKNLGVGCRWVL